MASLVPVSELAIWCQQTIAEDNPWALAVLDKASMLVREAAGHPEWESSTTPPRARLIALLVARRTFLNPDQVVSSSVGPLSERVLDEAAAGMTLTPAERLELGALRGSEDDPDPNGLWVLQTTTGRRLRNLDIYLPGVRPGSSYIPYLDPAADPHLVNALTDPS